MSLIKFYILLILLSLCISPIKSGTCQSSQKEETDSLCSIYNSTNGDNWLWSKVSLSTRWICDYAPVNLSNICMWYGVTCDATCSVSKIVLEIMNLTGNIRDIKLDNLIELNLLDNHLTGSLPLFSSDKIQNIRLRYNQLSGSVPDSYSKLKDLNSLRFSENKLSGAFPNIGMLVLIYILN